MKAYRVVGPIVLALLTVVLLGERVEDLAATKIAYSEFKADVRLAVFATS
jgi:hypothetical protein